MKKSDPIAIVGLSCMFPDSQTVSEYWGNIKNKVDSIKEVPKTHWDPKDFYDEDKKAPDMTYGKTGGFIPTYDFDPLANGMSPDVVESTDTSQILSVVVAQGAMMDAGYGVDSDFDRDRVSVMVGVCGTLEMVLPLGARLDHPKWRKSIKAAGVDDEICDEIVANMGNANVGWTEASFPGLLGNVVSGRIANRLDLGGTNCTCDAACASSFSALNLATLELETGRTDMVICGGSDTFNHIFMYMCFSKTPALSPTGDIRPMDTSADGTIIGEGIGMIVLKRLSDAERDGDKIYSVIRSVGSSSDGKGKAIYAPVGNGQKKALKKAWELADITPRDLDLIEAHGTGTKAGDAVEFKALREVFGEADGEPWCAIGSVKSQIGHTKAAAGISGLMKVAMGLYHKVLPPTIKVKDPVAAVYGEGSPFYVNTEMRPWKAVEGRPRRAGVSSFGFGGTNFHVVLEEYKKEKQEMDWNGEVEIVSLSASSEKELEAKVALFTKEMKWKDFALEAAKSRREFKISDKCRLATVVSRGGKASHEVFANLTKMMKAKAGADAWNTPDGAFYCSNSEKKGKLGIVFPGQGSQYTGMLSGLAGLSPKFQKILFDANDVFASVSEGEQIIDYVYPKVNFTKEEKEANNLFLTRTENAQPSIGIVSLGLMRLFEQFGLKPDSLTGHSYGEIVALTTAGVISEESCYIMSRIRGVLMSQGEGDRGSMLAVQATEEDVAKIIKEEKIDLVIANKNAPKQMVLSGATDEIVRARGIMKEKGLRCKQLSVAAAFHSKFVVPAADPFRKELDNHEFKKGNLPVYANVNAELYPEGVTEVKDVLGTQMSNAVEFVKTIENMYATGVRTFLEVGPGARLSGLVKNILGSEEHFSIAADSSNGARSNVVDFGRALAQLVALGYDLDLKLWQNGEILIEETAKKKKPIMTIPICGANYRNPKKIKEPVQRPLRLTVKEQAAAAPVAPKPVLTIGGSAPVNAPLPMAAKPAVAVAPVASYQAPVAPQISAQSAEALKLTQESIFAMQDMQARVADLHSQFLQGQAAASQSLANIVAQQKAMLRGGVVQSAPLATASYKPVAHGSTTMGHNPHVNLSTPAPAIVAAPVAIQNPLLKHINVQPVARPAAPAPVAKPVAPKPVAKAAAPATAPAGADMAKVESTILDVVSEKTGYPAEMLNLDMDMEADLGIDSIKKVEIMSAVQENLPEAPVVQPDQMTDLRTLRQVIGVLAVAGAAATPVAVAVAAAPAAGGASMAKVEATILDVVSEKTGYPAEMLNLDMDMEADLGIDSIKKVEIMSAVQESLPEAPVVQPDQMTDLRTLRQVIDVLAVAGAASVAAVAPVGAAPAVAAVVASGADMAKVEATILDVVSEKTGYPAEMLNLDMDMEADLGIDSIKKVEIMSEVQERLPEAPVVQPDQMTDLRTLRQVIDTLGAASASAAPVAAAAAPVAAAAGTPAAGGTDMAKVEATILDVVSEKTGYPAEMLNLDMDMEADLGIDSIKKVEIMSEVQERLPEAPVVQPDQMTDLRTLRQVIDTLGAAGAAATSGAPAAAAHTPTILEVVAETVHSSADMVKVEATILDVVSDKTGYPAEMLNLDMDMEADLGIDSIKKVEIMSEVQERLPEAPVVQPDQMTDLRTLRQVIETLGAAATGHAVSAIEPAAIDAAVATAEDGAGKVSMDKVEATILDVVSDKTGYPAEMLNLDMDMEADLGIDSIKKVEIMSEVQERLPEAPVVQPDQMTDLRTLRQVIDVIGAQTTAGAEPPEDDGDGAKVVTQPYGTPSVEAVPKPREVLLRNCVKAEPLTGERKKLSVEKNGVVWVVDNGTDVGKAVAARLGDFNCWASVMSVDEALKKALPPALSGLLVLAPATEQVPSELWIEDSEKYVKDVFALTQRCARPLLKAAKQSGAFFATVSRLDGTFGFSDSPFGFDPIQGGLAGLSKTAAHEWSEISIKAIDVDCEWTDKESIADAVTDEVLTVGPVEVGITSGGRVKLVEETVNISDAVRNEKGSWVLEQGDLVLVSGGGRGVTAECAIAIAREYKTVMVLLGRSALPEEEPAYTKGVTNEAQLKKAIMQNAVGSITPKALMAEYSRLLAGREIHDTIKRINDCGGKAIYKAVNVKDATEIASILEDLRKQYGGVRGFVHGAGVLRDSLIIDKKLEDLDLVFGTKVEGLKALLSVTKKDPLKFIALFSSSTARYGRKGQVDYAIANECLNKIGRQQAQARPDCRVVSVCWGPWDGGMVTPQLKKLFASEGVGVIPLYEGGEQLVDEITLKPSMNVEVVIGGMLEGETPQAGKPLGSQAV